MVSLVFPAYNRLEFTRQSWAALMANTDWSLVSEFHVYDDGSTDGTREWLHGLQGLPVDEAAKYIPESFGHLCIQHHETRFRSPMGLTLDWIRRSTAPLLAKLDNDTIYPPGWLNVALGVMDRYPKLDMLGLEAMRKVARIGHRHGNAEYLEPEGPHRAKFNYLTAKFVSGLGIYRREAFAKSLPQDGGYFGFEEWMQSGALKCGWIIPSLPVFLLDRMPMEPWRSLSESYVRQGWQRPWSLDLRYKPEQHAMWDWWRPVE